MVGEGTLKQIEQRVLWLAVRMVDYVNRDRSTEIKVGGHQASSASLVSVMTALWFNHIGGDDKVAVKPHASPVYHAIKYLTGELDRSYLTRLRRLGGLQAYPSRTKDPDVADFSTGSVGLGAVAPLFSAAARRYLDTKFGPRDPARFIALVGDAELDEGNVWEAIAEPALAGLGNVMLVVDANRQSLDRVVPDIAVGRMANAFAAAGWHVTQAKYGRRLQQIFDLPGGVALRRHIDGMSNEHYQSLFRLRGSDLREQFLEGAARGVAESIAGVSDENLPSVVHDLGGHDLVELVRCFRECDSERGRPSIVFAYTVKGYDLPFAGDPLNHAALLSPSQIDDLRSRVGLTPETEWNRFDMASPAGRVCAGVGGEINNLPTPPRPVLPLPAGIGTFARTAATARPVSTQDAFGRVLARLADVEGVAERLVTTSPDVAISTNLGGWINKAGVFSPEHRPDYSATETLLRWKPGPDGHHIELGISEMNLFMLLGQLGLSHDHHGEMLLPIGTVYDPFVLRGLDAFIYGTYSGSRFVVVGTPSGISLAPEGGAHQSTITPSVGIELPGVDFVEPAYAQSLEWLLIDALHRLSDPDGAISYLRLSTRPIDQNPFRKVLDSMGEDRVRADVVAGGYLLRGPSDTSLVPVVLAGSGSVMPELVAAAEELEEEGVGASVLSITSPDRLYAGWIRTLRRSQSRFTRPADDHHLATLIPPRLRRAPIVTVHDAASHTMAWLGSVYGQLVVPVGVDDFGESGTIPELYERFGLRAEQVVNSALVALAANGDLDR
ncbi:MAG: pyruvate dehydrogenase [bacterium]|nr:pyruvate dehydrogenase [bacterium]MDE0351335.1 pyruvate dehydrogenase [bacterium]